MWNMARHWERSVVWLALMLTPSSSSHGGSGTKMGTKDPSQAPTEILRQVPGPCCGRVSTYNINIALISKSAPSECSESELLISVTRDLLLFLSPISLAELTQLGASEWDTSFGSHLTALGEHLLEQPVSTGKPRAPHSHGRQEGAIGCTRDIIFVPSIP